MFKGGKEMGVELKIRNAVKRYGNNEVIKGLSLDVYPGEFFTLLGPSGCGKTTLLRMIIGFNSIEGGTFEVDGQLVNNIPIHKRNMGMVFQNYAVFPHMTVKENVAYGLKNQKLSKDIIDEKVDDILEVVKISDLKDRLPEQLSGGQQQRVALARAIVTHPDVLLMDEPLSNLDAKLRVDMRLAIKEIQKKVDITTIYVTHDQEEALAVSDRIAVMDEGIIQQIGSPEEIYKRPVNTFVASFIGTTNLFNCRLINGTLTYLNYEFKVPRLIVQNSEKVVVSVRPQEFIISKEELGIRGEIRTSTFLGLNTHYYVTLENGEEVEVIDSSPESRILSDGEVVYLQFKTETINVFEGETKRSIIEGVDRSETKN